MGQERLLSHYNGGGFSPFLQHTVCCSQMSWVQVIIDTAAHSEGHRGVSRLIAPIQVTITLVLAENRRMFTALWPTLVHQILSWPDTNAILDEEVILVVMK